MGTGGSAVSTAHQDSFEDPDCAIHEVCFIPSYVCDDPGRVRSARIIHLRDGGVGLTTRGNHSHAPAPTHYNRVMTYRPSVLATAINTYGARARSVIPDFYHRFGQSSQDGLFCWGFALKVCTKAGVVGSDLWRMCGR